ncbi:hypothetical protein J40TS1_38620 [Paenibacillus montaniterrae]|uniref:Uncharacterized protein n=1 Tax=Paenibacillus montaniterrae TaxID=429341 RepID=A0A919YRR1_9BACL|nr:hypothetical protein [Paenibacillus montaniterrae]GIP18220.1 hypothetical protein J40TS1_38620 [Paenibacillus montaniterrae]
MKMKIITTIALIIVITAIFLFNYSFPKEINIVKTAIAFVEYDEHPPILTKVHVAGTMYRPVFKQHRFEGKITIDRHDFTLTEQNIALPILNRENGVNYSQLVYFRDTKPFDPVAIASIYYDDNFEQFTIVTREEWIEKTPQSLYYIVSGQSYSEAFESQKVLSDRLGDDSFVAPQNSLK